MTATTLTLTDFLLARIAEDEETARNATQGPWWYDPSKMNAVDHEESVFAGSHGPSAITVASTGPCDDIGSMADAAHIARHDPARVLAECEAKRRIVEIFTPPHASTFDRLTAGVGLRALALPYANHPDFFREEWKL